MKALRKQTHRRNSQAPVLPGVGAPFSLPARAIAALAALSIWGSGCALGGSDSSSQVLVKECVLPTDQSTTIAGRWRVTPIPIAFHSGSGFSNDEMLDIVRAADTWNEFYKATQGFPVFDYGANGSVNVSSTPVPTNACATGLVQGNVFTSPVVIYKQGKWPHPSGAQSTIALTNFCTSSGKPYPTTYMAYMELNYQYFFVAGQKQPDLQTIVSHELGHLLGLYHSCDMNSSKTGTPNCLSPSLNTDYRAALMFPVFGFGTDLSGEVKRGLASNDQGRANCLYQKAATP
jgi:hypothetical protein